MEYLYATERSRFARQTDARQYNSICPATGYE